MRVIGWLGLAVLTVAACRRPQQEQNPWAVSQTPTAEPAPVAAPSAPEPEPEKKPEPPPPPKPSSEPPTSVGGFSLGVERKDAWRACSVKGTWKRDGDNWKCTKLLEDPGFGGVPVIKFCEDKACALGVVWEPAKSDFETWFAAYTKMKDAVTQLHGAPTQVNETVPDACKSDQFVDCVGDGRVQLELKWIWPTHLVRVRVNKKAGDGVTAVRYVSVPTAKK